MSWGHDEYVYQMMKDHLPEEGLYMLRYHSFYAWHREGEYSYLLDDHDKNAEMGEAFQSIRFVFKKSEASCLE